MMDKLRQEFEVAYLEYSEPLFRFCYFRIYDRERAKELVQETYTKTWDYICRGHTIENLRAFLYKVARNLCINEITRHKKHTSLEEMNEKTGFDVEDRSHVTEQERLEATMALERIKRLDPHTAEILILRFSDDLPIEEIATIVGESKNAITVKIHRAIKKLKKIYG